MPLGIIEIMEIGVEMELNCELTKQVIKSLQANGVDCYIVGGFVRDTLLGRESLDIDIELHNTDLDNAYAIISNTTKASIYGNFGVIALQDCNTEFAIARTESKIGTNHTDFNVEFITDGNLKLAASRRDFTINSLMYDLQTNKLLDFYHGQEDLNNLVLRHVGPAFSEDPLRILRAIKFITRYNLTIDSTTDLLCNQTANQLTYLPKSRIEAELASIFQNDYPYLGLSLLTKYLNSIFQQEICITEFSTNLNLNQIHFFKQFKNFEQVIDFCYEQKKIKKDLKFIINNYHQIVNYQQLSADTKFELLSASQYVLEMAVAINPQFEAYFKDYQQLMIKYNGNYFTQLGISGKQIRISQKQKIGGMLDELSNNN